MSQTRQSGWSGSEHPNKADTEQDKLLPYYESPFGREGDGESRHLRQSSNIIELFFDLFLAADLATFTEKHSTTNKDSLIAFCGFFIVIWSTWFQITLHDVRLVHDSIHERVCKFAQFIIFVAFALIGADFQSMSDTSGVGSEGDSTDELINFWLLSFALFSSRLLLALQYLTAFFSRGRPERLKTPLLLHVGAFTATAAAFVGFIGVLGVNNMKGSSHGYITLYLLLLLEIFVVLWISGTWSELNFTHTHLTERMGLLTFIMIGEGAIGAASTTIEIMSDRALSPEPVFLVICIVLILILLWTVYFDSLPSMPHGSLWQCVWACLHLPLHLSFIGILEGTRQVATIRYIDQTLVSFVEQVDKICFKDHDDGAKLGSSLLDLVASYEYGISRSTSSQSARLRGRIQKIADAPGICAAENTMGLDSMFDAESLGQIKMFKKLVYDFAISLSRSDESEGSDQAADGFELVKNSTTVVYLYYWSFALLMLLTFALLYKLNQRRNDLTTKSSLLSRLAMAVLAIIFLALHSSAIAWTSFISSLGMLPTLCAMLAFVVVVDRIGTQVRQKAARRFSVSENRMSVKSTDTCIELVNCSRASNRIPSVPHPQRETVCFTRFSIFDGLQPPSYQRQ